MSTRRSDNPSQSSLHSFFRPKPSQKSGRNVDDAVDLTSPTSSPPAKRAKLAPPENGTGSSSHSVTASTSSSYFSKRQHAPTHTEPTVNLASFRLPKTSAVSASISDGAAFDKYTLTHNSTSERTQQPVERTAEQQARHAAWQRLAGGPGGVIPRRRSLALDEAAAAEARRALGDDTPEDFGTEGDATPPVEDEGAAHAAEVGGKLRGKFASKDAAAPAPKRGRKKKEEEVGPSGMTYTPLEKQFMEIKAKWPDVLLLTEVGYKYKFHGDDAKMASRELGIAAFPSRNFYTASIPTHRLHVHVKKLISLGYKVGVVSQMETAALKKAGDNRNTPFVRELTHLYTAATYVEDSAESSSNLRDQPLIPGAAPPPTNALVAVVEQGLGGMVADDRVRIALVSVVPGTGDVVWDEFDDSAVRSELETRLTHLQPTELLLPGSELSKATEKVLKHVCGSSRTATAVRVERIKDVPKYNKAFDYLTNFYRKKDKGQDGAEIDLTGDDEDDVVMAEAEDAPYDSGTDRQPDTMGLAAGLPEEDAVLALVDFPKQIVVALAMIIQYMTPFGLEGAFRYRSSFTKFVNRAHMLLSGNTLINLEIYRNQTDGGLYGSLLWLLDHTKTRMGRRLMREWIGRPLLDVSALRARHDAVGEIMNSNTYHMEKLRSLLVNMPDLVRGLTRVQYGKATPNEVSTILVGLVRVASEFRPEDGRSKPFQSELLNNILTILPTINDPARQFHSALNLKAAKANEHANLWTDPERYPDIQDAKDCISVCESELDQHLKEIRKVVHRPAMNYVAVSGVEYLVEIPIRDAKSMPPKWVKVQSTKSVARFHTPEIINLLKERERHKETLVGAARRAFLDFQSEISECHELIVVSRQLAVVDCLISLAKVAVASGYCKPEFVAERCLSIKGGRHPMVEALRDDPYVPFDIDFSEDTGRAKVITGPNMAGKSSCVRAAALIVCLAQIGSFVPAESVTLGIHDAVQTRMGASDEIGRGKSTFMVELSETSDILRTVTERTLVILDELGRGTSTYDGVAIAYATLAHLARVDCNTLFVTHYPFVADQLATEFPRQVSNWHMAFDERTLADGSAEITFLYTLKRGLAEAAFGVWCARLAGLPQSILRRAQEQSERLKADTEGRAAVTAGRQMNALMEGLGGEGVQAGDVVRRAEVLRNTLTFLRS